MKKKLLVILSVVIIAVAGLAWYLVNRPDEAKDSSASQQQSGNRDNGETVTKTGIFSCLKHSGDGPHTMECAFGLHMADGTQYGLRATDDPAAFTGIGTGQQVEVTGTLDATKPHASSYDTAGTIEVITIRRLQE